MLSDDIVPMLEIMRGDGYKIDTYWSENRWAEDSSGTKIATAFVLQDSSGREFDVHAMNFDELGNGIPAWEEADDFIFKKHDLAGAGRVGGLPVQCITPDSQILCHTGYELPKKQIKDMDLLHEEFGVAYPVGY